MYRKIKHVYGLILDRIVRKVGFDFFIFEQ